MTCHFAFCRLVPFILISTLALAAEPATSFLKSSDIDEAATELLATANKSQGGDAGRVMQRFEGHWLLLLVRVRTGEAEVHERWADEIVIRQGSIDLLMGGTMTERHPFGMSPGEFHSAALTGGVTYHLVPGDVIDVPAGVPHWMKVTSTQPVIALVYKVK